MVCALTVLCNATVSAATYTWTGTTSALWTNSNNWNPTSGTPGVADGAVFNAAGNANTTIDLSGTSKVLSVLFDTSSAAAYTIGSGGVANQTLQLASSGTVAMTSTVANDQLINALLVLGTNAAAGSFTISNDSLTNKLTFAGGITGGSGGTGAAKTLTVGGAGATALSGSISNGGATSLSLIKSGLGTLTLTNANTYTGSTSITSGTLQIGNGGTAGSISSSSALTLGGAGLVINRSDSATQQFASTTFTAGLSTVAANSTNTLNFGAITRNVGAAVNIPATGSFITSTGNTNNILNGGITYGGTTWAVATGSSAITGLGTFVLSSTAGTTAANYTSGNVDIDASASPSAAITPNSLRFNSAGAYTLTLPAAANTVSSGGILVTSNVGANASTITGGTIAGASGGDLVVWQNNTSGTLTISSAIANNSTATGLTKAGPGTLVLGTNNTYTGTTTILGGVVQVSSVTNTLSSSVLLNGGTVAFTGASGNAWALNVGANGGTVLLTAANASLQISAGGITSSPSGSVLTLMGSAAGSSFRTDSGSFGPVKLVVNNTSFGVNRINTATGDDAFTLTNNGVMALNSSYYSSFGSSTYGVTIGSGTNKISLNGNGNVSFLAKISGTSASSTLTFAPSVNGASSFFTLSNTANSYASTTVVQTTNQGGGVGPAGLRLGASGVIPDGDGKGNVIVVNGGFASTLDLNGYNETINGLSSVLGSGTSTDSVVDNMLASSTSTLTLGGGNASALYAGTIRNSGSSAVLNLTKIGTGTQTLSGSNSYSGSTTVSAGELALGRATAIGTGTATVNGGVLNIGTYAPSVAAFVIASGSLTGSGTLTATNGYALQGGAVNAALGTGAITFSAGATTLGSAGRLNVASTLTGSSGQLTLGGNETVASLTLVGGTLAGTGKTLTAATYALQGGVVSANLGAGTINVTSGTATLSGTAAGSAINVSSGALALGGSGLLSNSGTLTVSGGILDTTSSNYTATVGTFNMSSGSLNGGGTITAGTYGLSGGTLNAALGTGAITFSTGATTLGSAGRLNAASTLTGSSGQLTLGGNEQVASFTLVGGTLAGTGNTLTAGTYALQGGVVSANLGAGTINVSGNSSLSGTASGTVVNLNGGTFTLSNGGSLASTAAVNATANGATLDISGLTASGLTIGSLSGSSGSVVTLGGKTLTFGDGNATTFAGSIGGAGGITKQGSGVMTLSGSNGYSGSTTISAGSISFGNKNAFSASSGIGIANGAGLTYTGAADTFSRNITVTGGTGSVTNSGSGVLTLGGTLTKNGTVLRLAGSGGFNVTGQIVGSSSNSDLYVDGVSVTLSNTNSYNGPTVVYNGGVLTLGTNNAIPSNSVVTLGDSSTRGTLTLGTFTNSIGGLVFSGSGGTLSLSGDKTDAVQLATSSGLTLGSSASLVLTSPGTSAGLYRLISATSISGSFASANVSGVPSNYALLYTGTEVDLQQKAVVGTISVTNPTAAIITGGTAAFSYTVANNNASGGANLSFTGSGLSNVGGSSSGSANPSSTSTSVNGLYFTGTSVGSGQIGTFTVSDPNAYGGTQTGTVSVNVLAHSNAALSLASGAGQTIITGGTFSALSFNLTNAGSDRAAVQVDSLVNLVGGTGSAVVLAGGTASYSAAILDNITVGSGTLGVSMQAGDQQSLSGAGAIHTVSSLATYTVLDHATSSLASAGPALTSLTLDLGTWDYSKQMWTIGTGSGTFSIYNLASSYGASLTAALSLTNYTANGGGFSTNLGSYADIAGGSSDLFTITADPASFLTSGSASRMFTLTMHDKTGMSGGTATNTLYVTANVIVVPEPGALALAGIGVGLAGWMAWRRRGAASK